MGERIQAYPQRLEDYTERASRAIGPAREVVDDYETALRAFNSAPKDLPFSIYSYTASISGVVDELAELDAKPAAFAWALRQLDRFVADTPRDRSWLATYDPALFEVLVEARLASPYASDAFVHDQAAQILASRYADRLQQIGLDQADASGWTQEMAEQHPQLAELFSDLEHYANWNPQFADHLVVELGGEGVQRVMNRLRTQHGALQYFSAVDGNVPEDLLAPFANLLEVAARDGGVDQRYLDDIIAGDPRNTALLLAVGDFGRRFLAPAFDAVWNADELYRYSRDGRDLEFAVMDGDMRVGALRGMSRDDEFAWERISASEQFRNGLVFGNYGDDGHAAGAALTAALYDYPGSRPRDRRLFAEAQEVFADIIVTVNEEHGGFLGSGKDLKPGTRIALAQISHLHLDDLAHVAAGSSVDGPIGDLDRDGLLEFFSDVVDEPQAQSLLAEGLGVYSGVQLAQGAEAAARADGDPVRFNAYTQLSGHLAALFSESVGVKVEDDAQRTEFLVRAAKSTATVLAAVGVAASPLSAGASAAVGGGAAHVLYELGEAVDVQGFDHHAEQEHLNRIFLATAVDAMVDHDEIVNRHGEPSVQPTARARLQDDAFIQAVIAGDPQATREFDEIMEQPHNDGLMSDALEARDEAWKPVDQYLGGYDAGD